MLVGVELFRVDKWGLTLEVVNSSKGRKCEVDISGRLV